MRIVSVITIATMLAGCLTLGGQREIQTTPAGAFVSIDGFGECETPCTVKLDQPRRARIAKAGYVTRIVMIEPGDGPIIIPLDLAAASEEVDTQALPDID